MLPDCSLEHASSERSEDSKPWCLTQRRAFFPTPDTGH